MPNLLTSAQVRQFDRIASEEFGLRGLDLMESAGRGVADALLQADFNGGAVVVFCGKGNNGGDGFVAARHLFGNGVDASVVAVANRDAYRGDVQTNLLRAKKAGVQVQYLDESRPDSLLDQLPQAEWAIDALLGVGAVGAPRPPIDEIIRRLNSTSSLQRLAIDLPSGLNPDTGEPAEPTLRADLTCTLLAAKPGLLTSQAEPFVGELRVIDLQAPEELLRRFDLV
jgi:NAD(P)H-hydrate epimerase